MIKLCASESSVFKLFLFHYCVSIRATNMKNTLSEPLDAGHAI